MPSLPTGYPAFVGIFPVVGNLPPLKAIECIFDGYRVFPAPNDVPLFLPTSSKEQERWHFTPAVMNDFVGEKIKLLAKENFRRAPVTWVFGCILTQIQNLLLRDKSVISLWALALPTETWLCRSCCFSWELAPAYL